MPAVLLGIVALVLLLWALQLFTKTPPQAVARVLRVSGGILALAAAVFFVATERFAAAVPLGIAGLTLLGFWPGVGVRGARKSRGQVSRVRSAFLQMELDHDTGALKGRVLAGRHEGKDLDALDLSTLVGLIGQVDEESRALLAAYLDRRDPGWREHAQADAAAGKGTTPRSGPMTQEEAYQILGLEPGASAEQIGRAHRLLMKRLHPDQGGSTYLAARVNEAKDVLLRRHR
jgi:DnaJ-domain-containing protein 1